MNTLLKVVRISMTLSPLMAGGGVLGMGKAVGWGDYVFGANMEGE